MKLALLFLKIEFLSIVIGFIIAYSEVRKLNKTTKINRKIGATNIVMKLALVDKHSKFSDKIYDLHLNKNKDQEVKNLLIEKWLYPYFNLPSEDFFTFDKA